VLRLTATIALLRNGALRRERKAARITLADKGKTVAAKAFVAPAKTISKNPKNASRSPEMTPASNPATKGTDT